MGRNERSVVVLSESDAAPPLAARLATPTPPSYGSVEDLLRDRPLSSIAVLVVQTRALPSAMLLVTLGRIGLEYPAMQKLVVMDGPPPLPVAGYLTACGVDLLWTGSGEAGTDRLAVVVERMRDRRSWIA